MNAMLLSIFQFVPRMLFVGLILFAGCTEKPDAKDTSGTKSLKNSESNSTDSKSHRANSQRALTLLEQKKFDRAWEEAQECLLVDENDSKALFVMGVILGSKKEYSDAIELMQKIAYTAPVVGDRAELLTFEWLLLDGQWRTAVSKIEQSYKKNPNDPKRIRLLLNAYTLTGRRADGIPLIRALVDKGIATEQELRWLIDPQSPIVVTEDCERALKKYPDDPLPRVAQAFLASYKWDYLTAEKLFREVVAAPDPSIPAKIGLCAALIGLNKYDEARSLLADLPESAWNYADTWVYGGALLLEINEVDKAARCFCEALARDPNHPEALQNCISTMSALGKSNDDWDLSERLKACNLLRINGEPLSIKEHSLESFENLAKLLFQLNRDSEAIQWLRLSGNNDAKTVSRLISQVVGLNPPLASIDLAALPPTDWSRFKKEKSALSQDSYGTVPSSKILLEEVTKKWGVDFQYDNAAKSIEGGFMIYQSTGGGCAIIDFDQDGFMDMYLPQAGAAPLSETGFKINAMYKNIGGTRFENVTSSSLVDNRSYGQGAAAGDWNQDGFTDLYVANLGANTLWMNQGDGTFAKMELKSTDSTTPLEYTSSVCIADITGDSLPDLIDINYVVLESAITRHCFKEGREAVCDPTLYPAADDRYWVNDGQGGFIDDPNIAKVGDPDGRGLGILVTNFDDKAGNDIFIANDGSVNYFLVSHPVEAESRNEHQAFHLIDEAAQRGCGSNRQGRPQACMGVGFGDINRDGYADLFVTNFYYEHNTVYVGSKNSSFNDQSQKFGFLNPSKQAVGFGSQLVDLNHDGILDLFFLNGHIDNFLADKSEFRMRAELLAGDGRRFIPQDIESNAPYLKEKNLGRALAMVDIDRDGHKDFIATHLDRPVAVLRNATEDANHYIGIRLIGKSCDRDAVGAKVIVHCGAEAWTLWVTKGDGYFVSNDPELHTGIGRHNKIDSIDVVWPDGINQTIGEIDADQSITLVQGESPF